MESLDLRRAVSLIGTDGDDASWRQFDAYHRSGLRRLEASGAELALMASNTPHHRFASIIDGVGIPVINMFETVAKHCAGAGHRQVLILGTALTMRSKILRSAFEAHGVAAAAPDHSHDRESVLAAIAKLQRGEVEGVAQLIGDVVRAAWGSQLAGRPVVCLACTELPLAFPAVQRRSCFEADGVHYVNTSVVHLEAALDMAFTFPANQGCQLPSHSSMADSIV